ncbi:uncharacterized protein LOC117892396 [Drosophila subobscura]|uniref:uncharacterized protein LOC117892396 n=1 Tax=Drosophila subobscura TaxID=7241 RepID=UPI00155A78C8|nr:uncharacterized protein LOC117892396 [Drosophila subobscura]
MGNSEKMQRKWFTLSLTGSLGMVHTFVRKYTDQSERGGVLIGNRKESKAIRPHASLISNSSRNSSEGSSRRQTKRSSSSKIVEGRTECNSEKCDQKQSFVDDSPRMREFFKEVRERELKEYYLRMRAAQRLPASPCSMCPNCGFETYSGAGPKVVRALPEHMQSRNLEYVGSSSLEIHQPALQP